MPYWTSNPTVPQNFSMLDQFQNEQFSTTVVQMQPSYQVKVESVLLEYDLKWSHILERTGQWEGFVK